MFFTSTECRVIAEEKLPEAGRDERHHRRLITAAQGWLFLAGQLRRLEKSFGDDEAEKRAEPSGCLRLAAELPFECRHGPPLLRDLQHLLLNEMVARRLGAFFAFARLVAVLVGLALRHRTVPKT